MQHQYYLPEALESFQNPDHENIHIAWSLLGRENLEEEGLGTPLRSLVGPILSSQLPQAATKRSIIAWCLIITRRPGQPKPLRKSPITKETPLFRNLPCIARQCPPALGSLSIGFAYFRGRLPRRDLCWNLGPGTFRQVFWLSKLV